MHSHITALFCNTFYHFNSTFHKHFTKIQSTVFYTCPKSKSDALQSNNHSKH